MGKAGWQPLLRSSPATEDGGATKENIPGGSSTEEQRSQAAFTAKTLRGVGSFVVCRRWLSPDSPLRGCSVAIPARTFAALAHAKISLRKTRAIFRQALNRSGLKRAQSAIHTQNLTGDPRLRGTEKKTDRRRDIRGITHPAWGMHCGGHFER